MRIAVIQMKPVFGEIALNRAHAIDLISSAPADVYVLPELCMSGYVFTKEREAELLSEPAEGPTSQAFAEVAKELGSTIVYGFAERSNRIYNSAAVVGPAGLLGVYRKVHLFDREQLFFAPGDLGFPVFDTPHGRIGVMICFDWLFPESARTLALNGAQLIAHPSNLVLPHCPDAMVTRCLENRVYAATADRTGVEERGGVKLTFIGSSEIVGPDGKILARMGKEEEGACVCNVDLCKADDKHVTSRNDLFAGRRPDQYSLD